MSNAVIPKENLTAWQRWELGSFNQKRAAPAAPQDSDERSLRDEAQEAVRSPRSAPSGTDRSAPAESGGGWLGDLLQGSGRKDSVLETVAKSAARTIGSTVGREIIRGVLGSLLGGSRRR